MRSPALEKGKGGVKEQVLADKHTSPDMSYVLSFYNHNGFFCSTVFILP